MRAATFVCGSGAEHDGDVTKHLEQWAALSLMLFDLMF
jgi:hypothetical protein